MKLVTFATSAASKKEGPALLLSYEQALALYESANPAAKRDHWLVFQPSLRESVEAGRNRYVLLPTGSIRIEQNL